MDGTGCGGTTRARGGSCTARADSHPQGSCADS
jgi:hypothetical protein